MTVRALCLLLSGYGLYNRVAVAILASLAILLDRVLFVLLNMLNQLSSWGALDVLCRGEYIAVLEFRMCGPVFVGALVPPNPILELLQLLPPRACATS